MLHVQVDGHVVVWTIDRPEARNAFDAELSAAMERAVDAFESNSDLWIAILGATASGERPVFCAGADLKAIAAGHGDAIATERGGFGGLAERARSKPIIGAVDGHAAGGGLELLLGLDIIVASDRSSFALPEVKHGLIASGGGLHRLPRRIGLAPAMQMILTGRSIDAAAAMRLGLVSEVVSAHEVMDAARSIADDICAASPSAVRLSRQLVLEAVAADEDQLRQRSLEAADAVEQTEDFAEAMAALSERRPPQWLGR